MGDNGSQMLVRLLDRAVRMGDPALLMIGGSGTVSVYPRQNCYVSDIQDWDSVYTTKPEQIRVMPTAWGAAPTAGALPLEELQWRAAYYSVLNQDAGANLTRELLQLKEWPNLTRVPEELMPVVARVCALLWRKPTVGYLIPRILGIAPEQVKAVLEVLQQLGHVNRPRLETSSPEGVPAEAPTEEPAPASLAAKLLQRLLRF